METVNYGKIESSDGILIEYKTTVISDSSDATIDQPVEVIVYMAHALTYFKELWDPVIENIYNEICEEREPTSNFMPRPRSIAVVSFDFRGHGNSSQTDHHKFDQDRTWWPIASDFKAVVNHTLPIWQQKSHSKIKVVGVGHSMGGAGAVMVEILQPNTFDWIILFEPIIFPKEHRDANSNSLVAKASKRKSAFASMQEFKNYHESKSFMKEWDKRAIDAYFQNVAYYEEKDNTYMLKCPPWFESAYYQYSIFGLFEMLWRVKTPVLLITSNKSDSMSTAYAKVLEQQFVNAVLLIVEGNHYWPMTKPGQFAKQIKCVLQKLQDNKSKL